MIEAQGTAVVVVAKEQELKTAGGLILSGTTLETYYEIVSVGSEAKLTAAAGDTVIITANPNSQRKFTYEDQDYFIIDSTGVYVKVK
tara:strand:+ start:1135 stop:1395 length:261 start_codon:yes stop_codon:yes gene_type:complete